MRSQLPLFLRIFSYIPATAMVAITLVVSGPLLFLPSSTEIESRIRLVSFLVLLIGIILSMIAEGKLEKLKLGINPKYLSHMFPKSLESQVSYLLRNNFSVVSKTGTTAHLERPPHFDWGIAIIGLPTVLITVIYLVYHFTRPKETVLLDLDTQ